MGVKFLSLLRLIKPAPVQEEREMAVEREQHERLADLFNVEPDQAGDHMAEIARLLGQHG